MREEEGEVRSLKVREEEKQFEVCGCLLCRISHGETTNQQGLLLNYLVDSTFKMQFPGSRPLLYSQARCCNLRHFPSPISPDYSGLKTCRSHFLGQNALWLHYPSLRPHC